MSIRTVTFESVEIGSALPALDIPITTTLVVAGAMAAAISIEAVLWLSIALHCAGLVLLVGLRDPRTAKARAVG